jgi:hypothetical protein
MKILMLFFWGINIIGCTGLSRQKQYSGNFDQNITKADSILKYLETHGLTSLKKKKLKTLKPDSVDFLVRLKANNLIVNFDCISQIEGIQFFDNKLNATSFFSTMKKYFLFDSYYENPPKQFFLDGSNLYYFISSENRTSDNLYNIKEEVINKYFKNKHVRNCLDSSVVYPPRQ